jgi:molybdate/tungstate transport system substrate-binding protein
MLKTTWRLMIAGALALILPAGPVAAQTACIPGSPQVSIYHAGSLTAAFSQIEKLFTQQTGICVVDVAAGSVDLARRCTAGGEPCDIYASADFEDIDVLVKPAGFARYNILFGKGEMVLAYTTTSRNAATIAAPGVFNPPASVPDAASDWYAQLLGPGVTVGGSHPFLDPSGYRSHMIFQLAEEHYRVSNLYDSLLTHYTLTRPTDALGKTFDYQITYAHSALAAFKADATNSYRFVKLPDDVSLGAPDKNRRYGETSVIIPGLRVNRTAPDVRIPATRVVWGLTVLKNAPNPENAIRFLQLLFGQQGVAVQTAVGPAPISPPLVSHHDFEQLPGPLRSIVRVEPRD